MAKHNAANERLKHDYLQYLKEAKGRNEASLDAVAKALARFEDSTGRKAFKTFHREQALAFKRRLAEQLNARTGQKLSKATLASTMRELRTFFSWLAGQPGFKKCIRYSDADYFNLSEKDLTIARATRPKRVPTLEQMHKVLDAMPTDTVLEKRNRALVAMAMLTGARGNALASFKLRHVDLVKGMVFQDGRDVRTKRSKTFPTYFCPVGGNALTILTEWTAHLRDLETWGPDDPLFPATAIGVGEGGGFVATGLARFGWCGTQPIRDIFRNACQAAEQPYFNPHTVRDMLAQLGERLCVSAEAFKAWSQNIGHSDVLTTFTSYGAVPEHRQAELIRTVG